MLRVVVALLMSVLALLLAGVMPAEAESESRVALVIGNGAYQHLPRLDNPANDARLIATTLQGLGFALIGGGAQIDLDRAGFERAIREFGAKLTGGSVGLFYYAGHGVQVQGENYLVPVGANPTSTADVDFELIDAELVLKQMAASGSKLNFVILDACRNNPFGGRGLRDVGGGLAQMKAPTGTLISYATQPGNVALDGTGAHSPYAAALAAAMRQPGLGVFEVFNTAAVIVKNETGGNQQPWVSNSPIEGNFYFLGPTNITIQPPAPAAPSPADAELVFWQSILASANTADFDEYLRKYPNGQFAGLARNRLAALRPPSPPASTPTPAQPMQQVRFVGYDNDRRESWYSILVKEQGSDREGSIRIEAHGKIIDQKEFFATCIVNHEKIVVGDLTLTITPSGVGTEIYPYNLMKQLWRLLCQG